jgi:hypothetical protein
MAQTRKKRRRKHRGTQAGNIERPGRTGRPSGSRPASRAEAKQTAQQRRLERMDREPTWRSSLNRAGFAAAILAIFVSVVQKNVAAGVVLGVLALIIYVPMSYYTDRALWRRRMRKKQHR